MSFNLAINSVFGQQQVPPGCRENTVGRVTKGFVGIFKTLLQFDNLMMDFRYELVTSGSGLWADLGITDVYIVSFLTATANVVKFLGWLSHGHKQHADKYSINKRGKCLLLDMH